MSDINWVFDLPCGLIIGGLILIAIGVLMLYWRLDGVGLTLFSCAFFIGAIIALIGCWGLSFDTYFVRTECDDIDQMIVDHNAVEMDRDSRIGSIQMLWGLACYKDDVLVHAEAFGHECWIYYPADEC